MERAETLSISYKALKELTGVFAFSFLTALGARIKIPLPFTPVPVTLQVLFVLLSGTILGRVRGPISQLLYLALGSLGLPFFAGGGGSLYLFGPTGGYLIGFVVASYIAGMSKGESFSWSKVIICQLAGLGTIYLLGIIHLSLYLGVTLSWAIKLGLLPFIGVDFSKLILSSLITGAIHGRRG
ncbi:MAG TPA: biotin transporter BioY [bacterium]|nr:biotin transporter BioY [bacterium]HEX68436.1 biotin transporter BioY [bacterium]